MNHLVKIYNKTLHETIKMTPTEMQNDREAETKYIIKKLYQVERRKKIGDFELPVGTWVRYIVPRDPQKKNRYKISHERYQIKGKAGNAYILMDGNGHTVNMSRWRLLPYLGKLPPDEHALKVGKNLLADKQRGKKTRPLEERGDGMYDHIEKVEKLKNGKPVRYLMVWKSVDGEAPARTWVTVATPRAGQTDMNAQCKLEKEFYARQAAGRARP
jgi:hypothetical protein